MQDAPVQGMVECMIKHLYRFHKWCRPLHHRDQASSLAVIPSEARYLLLYAGIGPFSAEKQIPRADNKPRPSE